jgi:hypothetical protein
MEGLVGERARSAVVELQEERVCLTVVTQNAIDLGGHVRACEI